MINAPHKHDSPDGKRKALVKRWKIVGLLWLITFSTLFLFAASKADADMVFDFQKKLADKDNAEAQFNVGEMYQTGRGVKKDPGAAVGWFKKATQKGHIEAGYKLLYLGIKKNGMTAGNKNAAKVLTNKARAGDGVSQYYLGLMYQNGVGLKRSNNNALDWYKKAANQGVTAAEQGIEEIETAKRNWVATETKRKATDKLRAELAKKKKAETLTKAKAKKEAALAARKQAQVMLAAEREKKRQALIKARQDRAKAQQTDKSDNVTFESDPCSGKSARFLSTCR